MDFIQGLPPDNEGRDTLLTVTCKFSKRVLLIMGKSTWSAEQWSEALLEGLRRADWGIPVAIISDRDRKFNSEIWRGLFKLLGTSILMGTAYYP